MGHEERLRRNDKSRNKAGRHRESWDPEDVEFLLVFFDEAKGDAAAEAEVAEVLGRTIEACRQFFYEIKSGRRDLSGVRITTQTTRTTTTTTTVTEYIGAMDDPDDQWWSPGYYTGGGSHA